MHAHSRVFTLLYPAMLELLFRSEGAFVCLFAEKVVRRFLSGGQIATLYNPKQKLSDEIVESARQEIGKVACRIFDQQNSPNKE